MKLPFTEKFLWDLFNTIQAIDEAFGDSPIGYIRTMREAFYPDLYKFRREWERKKDRKNFNQLVSYLKRKGWIRIKELEGKKAVFLTKEGSERILRVKMKMAEKKVRRDGKWIMIIFDIPETKRKVRDHFRTNLRILGYENLQKSIWICPYNVLKETQELIKEYSIEPYTRLLLVDEMEIK